MVASVVPLLRCYCCCVAGAIAVLLLLCYCRCVRSGIAAVLPLLIFSCLIRAIAELLLWLRFCCYSCARNAAARLLMLALLPFPSYILQPTAELKI